MKCAIMQPTYLPWSGYFNLIASVDHFVFLDNVQYERRSWQARNRILVNGAEHLLAVPVERCPQDTPLDQVRISEVEDWRRRHWLTLKAAYEKAATGRELLAQLEPHLTQLGEPLLARFTEAIIRDLVASLGITTRLWRASELPAQGVRSERFASLCKALDCTTYLSPRGSMQYLEEDDFSARFGIALEFQSFEPQLYSQWRAAQFVSHLSIIDVIANLGLAGARSYLENQLDEKTDD